MVYNWSSTIFTIIFAVVGLIFGMNINSEKTDLRETMNKITTQAAKSEEDLKKFEKELKEQITGSRESTVELLSKDEINLNGQEIPVSFPQRRK
jgi:hypothetical protein